MSFVSISRLHFVFFWFPVLVNHSWNAVCRASLFGDLPLSKHFSVAKNRSLTIKSAKSCYSSESNYRKTAWRINVKHTNKTFGLSSELFAELGPSLLLSCQATDQTGGGLHLMSTALCILQQCLLEKQQRW